MDTCGARAGRIGGSPEPRIQNADLGSCQVAAAAAEMVSCLKAGASYPSLHRLHVSVTYQLAIVLKVFWISSFFHIYKQACNTYSLKAALKLGRGSERSKRCFLNVIEYVCCFHFFYLNFLWKIMQTSFMMDTRQSVWLRVNCPPTSITHFLYVLYHSYS